MKKALAAVLFMCLALSALAGCGEESKDDTITENSIVSKLTPEEEYYRLIAQYTPERKEKTKKMIEAEKEYCTKVNQFLFKDAKKSFDATKRLIDSHSIGFIRLNFMEGVETDMTSVEGGKLKLDKCEVTVSGTSKNILKLIDDIQMSPDTGYITKIDLEPQTNNEANDKTYVVSLNIEFPYFEDVTGEYKKDSTASGASANTKSLARGISPEEAEIRSIISEEVKWYRLVDNAVINYERIFSRYTTIKISSLVNDLFNHVVHNPKVVKFGKYTISLSDVSKILLQTTVYFRFMDEYSEFNKELCEVGLSANDSAVLAADVEIDPATGEKALEAKTGLSLTDNYISENTLDDNILNSLEKYGSLINENPK